jgi:hypothetical protein
MVRQTAHGAPIVGGYAACVPPEQKEALVATFFSRGLTLQKPRGTTAQPPPPRITRRWLKELKEHGIGTIILKPSETREALKRRYEKGRKRGELPFFLRRVNPAVGFPDRRLRHIVAQLERYLGPPVYEDGDLMVWNL